MMRAGHLLQICHDIIAIVLVSVAFSPKARSLLFEAVRLLAASPESIQTRLTEAAESLLSVTIDEFAGDPELPIKFARILDLIAPDREDVEAIAVETPAYMSDARASLIAGLSAISFARLRKATHWVAQGDLWSRQDFGAPHGVLDDYTFLRISTLHVSQSGQAPVFWAKEGISRCRSPAATM